MLLSDEELARLETAEPFLREEARSALPDGTEYEVVAELREHLQPGLRLRVRPDAEAVLPVEPPPYPLDLFVGLPLDELRQIAHVDGAARDAAIARFGATFAPRLLRAIATLTQNAIDLDAGVQSEAGPLAVILDPAD